MIMCSTVYARPTFWLLPSSSEELEDSSPLDGIVSKSSVSMEGRRLCVQPGDTTCVF